MKKRFLTFILTIATMLMCIFGFSACGGNVEFAINFVVENEVYATVSTSGNEVISMPENPTKDDYTFDGWYWDENTWEKPFTANSLLDAPLSSDMKVYAKFNKNHTHEYTPTTTEPTCTEKGLITYTCSCGDSYTEDIPATGVHTWDDGKITTEPTCTEKGVKTFTCTVCKTATYTEDVEALKHDEKTHEAKAPTCTEIGWEEYITCEREGCEYSTYVEISALNHDKVQHNAQAATCTEIGWEAYETCSRCDYTTYVEIPALTHDKVQHNAQAATCTEKGWNAYETCSRCDYTTYVELPALGHDEKMHEAQAPTCTEIGWNEYETCSRCEYSTYAEIPATGVHTWDDGKETKAPTCTKEGETTYTCTVCKTATKTESIDKLPHEHAEKWTSNETHHWHECVCGDKKGEEKHTAGAPATATTPQTCTVCGYVIQEETGILFNTLTVDGTNVYGKVSNDTEIFSFINEITVKGNATYVVDVNMSCKDPIESKTVELSVGNNKFYVLEKIGNDVKLFTVTIRRRPMYEVTFNANGGASVEKQVIEEDYLATEPETTRTGYTFTGWDYDFTQAITENTKITASWSANTDTKYTVNYYLQNLDDSNYTLHESVELKGETDTPTAEVDIKEYTHFTYNANKSVISGNIDGDGSQVLNVYYTRDTYSIVANNNNAKAGTSTQINGTYKYDKEFTLTATTNAGYTWLGWYDGETCICEDEEFTFKVEKDVTYTASWSANEDTKYTVIYYLQNLDDSNYTPYETVKLKGETDTPTAKVDIKEYTHFTYNANKSVISGNIDGDGGQILSVYYTRNTYTISVNNTSYGTTTKSGNHKYGKVITATASVKVLGYAFIGWYSGEVLLSTDTSYTFTVDKNVMAQFAVKAEMSNFNFTSTASSCSISGIKNKTVTEIVVPDYVTSISQGAFSGCSSLKNITIPFVGGSRKTASDTYQYAFGYIFGTSSYTGGRATTQWYYGSSTSSTTYTTYYIPTSLKSVTITGGNILYGAFYHCDSLTSIEIPDGVTSIGSNAFISCGSLTSIEIPDGVTSIGSNAFYSCGSLTSVVIGDSVTSIGEYAFYDCDSLTSIIIPDSVTSIGEWAFYSCSSLTSVVIGDSVTSIGEYAFYNCDSLTSIIIPDSVTSIGYAAFNNCSSLTEITLPFVGARKQATGSNAVFGYIFGYTTSSSSSTVSGATYQYYDSSRPSSYKYYHYYIPTSLRKVTITGGTINSSAFRNCSSLTSVVIGDSVTSIGDRAFNNCSSLTSIIIPDSVTSIGEYAFNNCSSLTSVEIGDSVTSIGSYAFCGCDGLWSVVIPDSVTSIGSSAFEGCDSLTSVVIGDSVTSIGDEAFRYCDSLTSVVIGDSVTSIGSYAFSSCDSLTSVVIGDSVTSIGSSAFYNCYKLVEVVNKSTHIMVTKGDSSNGGVGYYALAVYNSGDTFTSKLSNDNGYIVYTDGTEKILVGYNGTETDLVLPSYITKINQYAFRNCSSLTEIVIPDSVTSIGSSAFYDCDSLTSVVIGNGVTSIGSYAFYDCDSLAEIVIPDSVTSIGDEAFYECSSLTSVVIGNGVTSIGSFAFAYCISLTSVVIGNSVTSIGYYAFYDCDSLTSITFKDTSTWYRTTDFTNWQNKTDGTETTVTTPSTNATYFKSTYYDYYWYKL